MDVKLNKQKNELETHKDNLKRLIYTVEGEKEANREKLQVKEKEIENGQAPEKLQEIFKEKDDLLQACWKLEQTKKDYDTLLLHKEEMLELLETHPNALPHMGTLGENLL